MLLSLLVIGFIHLSNPVKANEAQVVLEVIDPFIELHSGPAKGYPVFYTIEQGETITILSRRTGWYELKADNGRTGWAQSSQVARTLLPTGVPVDLPSVSYGDYLKNSWQVGFKVGQFSSGEFYAGDTFSYSIGYRPLSWMGVELDRVNFFQTQVKGDLTGINLLFEPYTDWIVSPVIIIGTGKTKLQPQTEGVQLGISKQNFTRFGLAGNYYIGRNFMVNLGYQSYKSNSDTNNERFNQWQLGFSAFF